MAHLLTNDEHFGDAMVGTREEFRAVLLDNFRDWYRDYQGALDVDDDGMNFDEYVEYSLDEHLSTAEDWEIENLERLNA